MNEIDFKVLIQKEITFILDYKELPIKKIIDKFEDLYLRLFGTERRRTMFLWAWCSLSIKTTSIQFRGFSSKSEERVGIIKLIGVILDVLIDDIADEIKDPVQSAKLIRYIKEIFQNRDYKIEDNLTEDEENYLEFIEYIWKLIWIEIKQLPLYETYKNKLEEGYWKLFEVIEYSNQINLNPYLIEYEKYENLFPHNMHMYICGIIDLMKVNMGIQTADLDKFEELILTGQKMGRICNVIVTFDREVASHDLSNDIFALAKKKGLVNDTDFFNFELLIKKISKHKDTLIKELYNMWDDNLAYIFRLKKYLNYDNILLDEYISGLKDFKEYHIINIGKL